MLYLRGLGIYRTDTSSGVAKIIPITKNANEGDPRIYSVMVNYNSYFPSLYIPQGYDLTDFISGIKKEIEDKYSWIILENLANLTTRGDSNLKKLKVFEKTSDGKYIFDSTKWGSSLAFRWVYELHVIDTNGPTIGESIKKKFYDNDNIRMILGGKIEEIAYDRLFSSGSIVEFILSGEVEQTIYIKYQI